MRHTEPYGIAVVAGVRRVTTRRAFIGLAVAGVASAARPAGRPRRIGFIAHRPRPNPGVGAPIDAFFAGMRDLGYEEGRDYVMEWKVTDGIAERYPRAAAELVASQVDLILCGITTAAIAAKNATSTIPIVMTGFSDPVTSGLVPSLARPGGNLTGLSSVDDELHGKRLELLRELLPAIDSIAVLWNAEDATHRPEVAQMLVLGRRLGFDIQPVELSRVEDVAAAFERLERLRPAALFVPNTAWHVSHGAAVFAAATRARLPAVGSERLHATAGALLAYGADLRDLWRRAAGYVDKIFRGALPADLPIQQPTKFELVINLKTAKALGLTIPRSLLLRADEVIQ